MTFRNSRMGLESSGGGTHEKELAFYLPSTLHGKRLAPAPLATASAIFFVFPF
jgi:hypothetical protein